MLHGIQRFVEKYAMWLRYFRHIPLSMVFGKMWHRIIERLVIRNPEKYLPEVTLHEDVFHRRELLHFAECYKVIGERFSESHLIEHGVFRSKDVIYDFGSIDEVNWDYPFENNSSNIHWWHDLSFFSFTLPLAEGNPRLAIKIIDRLVSNIERDHPLRDSKKLHFIWSPIALSLRVMGICSSMALIRNSNLQLQDSQVENISKHILKCYSLLNLTSERYLGYNHHIFAETALFTAAISMGVSSDDHLSAAVSALDRHILSDGMWSERSPTYHVHMLLLAKSMYNSGAGDAEVRRKLSILIEKMVKALECLVHPDGEIAVFNDSAIEDATRPIHVGWQGSKNAVCWLPEAGFCRISQGRSTIIFDAGPMGPDDVIGHGHADFLSFELSIGLERLIVDPGVASIAADAKRNWTRSASSHNGPRILGVEPAEFFGAWRVGRRGKAHFDCEPSLQDDGSILVSGVCNGYKHYGDLRRRIQVFSDGKILVQDSWPLTSLDKALSNFIISNAFSLIGSEKLSLQLASIAGSIVKIDVLTGYLVNMTPDWDYFPFGPLAARRGTLISMSPDESGVLEFLIECVPPSVKFA